MIDFWPQAILKKDFLQRFLAVGYQKIIPFNIRLNSDDPCPHATIKVKKTKFIAIPCIISFFCFNFVLLETITNNINNINELWKTTLS